LCESFSGYWLSTVKHIAERRGRYTYVVSKFPLRYLMLPQFQPNSSCIAKLSHGVSPLYKKDASIYV